MACAFCSPLDCTGASMQFSSAVMWGKRLKFWNTIPIFDRMFLTYPLLAGTSWPFCGIRFRGSPSTKMTPSWIPSSVIRTRRTVVLPEPDGPMIATTSFSST